jgi:predicted nucleotidyltransferase
MPTTLELTHEERKRYIALARQRDASQAAPVDPSIEQDRLILLGRVRQAAAKLKTAYGARKVILFGSLVHAAWFSSASDVDIAVEGLPAEAYWAAWRMIEQLVAERSVDLVELETARPSLRDSIESDGMSL